MRAEPIARSIILGLLAEGGGSSKRSTSPRAKRLRLSRISPPSPSKMRARVLVGAISRRSTGATRSGLIGKSEYSSGHAVTFAGLQIQQAVGIDGDGVAFDGRRGRDRFRDDFRIDHQALRPRLDQAGAKLREIEDARHQRDEAREVERNDAAGEAGKGQREEKLPGAAQPAERPPPPFVSGALSSATRS